MDDEKLDKTYLRRETFEAWKQAIEGNIGRLYWFAGTMVLGLVSLVVAAFHGRLG